MDIISPQFMELNLERANNWHHGGIEEWSLPDWLVAMGGEFGEACGVMAEEMMRQKESLADFRLNELLVMVMWQLGEAMNAAKKLRRIEDDLQNTSDRPLTDERDARKTIASLLLSAQALIDDTLRTLPPAYSPSIRDRMRKGEHSHVPEYELPGMFLHEMADTLCCLTLVVSRVGAKAEDFNEFTARVFNKVSERYGFPERIEP